MQNLNSDGHEIEMAAAGSLEYWITFDSSDAFLTSMSGKTYDAPKAGTPAVPDQSSTGGLLGIGCCGAAWAGRRRRIAGAG